MPEQYRESAAVSAATPLSGMLGLRRVDTIVD
jgi:hypothetical protein